MKRSALLLGALLGLGLSMGDAIAQPAPSSDEQRARERFQAGVSLFEEGNLEAALSEFQASFALRPVPVVLFNVAQTLKLLFRYDEAIAAYRRYLVIGGEQLPPERVREVEVTVERLGRSIARLVVECAPAGARVQVDGRLAGTTPLAGPLAIAAGRRRIRVESAGHAPLERETVFRGGATETLCARLSTSEGTGTLRITSPVAGAIVKIDGHRVGMVPVEQSVAGGGHMVEVTAPGHSRFVGEVSVRADQVRRLDVPLEEVGGSGVLGAWWFWTVTGAVVAGGAIAAFVLTRPEDASPIPGNVEPPVVSAAW